MTYCGVGCWWNNIFWSPESPTRASAHCFPQQLAEDFAKIRSTSIIEGEQTAT